MLDAAQFGHFDSYMLTDHALDQVVHQASHHTSVVKCVAPLMVRCRRFWYAYQHEGDMIEDVRAPICSWPKALPLQMKPTPWLEPMH